MNWALIIIIIKFIVIVIEILKIIEIYLFSFTVQKSTHRYNINFFEKLPG